MDMKLVWNEATAVRYSENMETYAIKIQRTETTHCPQGIVIYERTKITNSNQSHKSYKKYKSENRSTRTLNISEVGSGAMEE
jgi:hypothetical protein